MVQDATEDPLHYILTEHEDCYHDLHHDGFPHVKYLTDRVQPGRPAFTLLSNTYGADTSGLTQDWPVPEVVLPSLI